MNIERSNNRVLVGDVGGTYLRFAIAKRQGEAIEVSDFERLEGDRFDSFYDALSFYIDAKGLEVVDEDAAFALAGPVHQGQVRLTNRDWVVSEDKMKALFRFNSVRLVNDFNALATAVPMYLPSRLTEIRKGKILSKAPVVVAGPGTGFGVATLIPNQNSTWRVLAGEGGHMAYAPQTKIEYELASRLRSKVGVVSNELVCSGYHLDTVHRALCEVLSVDYEPATAPQILMAATSGDAFFATLCSLRARAVLGAVADLVYANGALGGVVLAGGVAIKLERFFKEPESLASFEQRGTLNDYLEHCPIFLLQDSQAPLVGSAMLAADL